MLSNTLFSSTASRNISAAHLDNDPTSTLVSIAVGDTKDIVAAYLHTPPTATATASPATPAAGALLVSGIAGGVAGPTGMYLSLATRLTLAGVHVLRMDYRYPGHTNHCAADMRAAMDYLAAHAGVAHFVLVGWSFGSAPVFTLAEGIHSESEDRIKAIAVIAPQTANAFGIRNVAPTPVLLVHGTDDKCLSMQCSVQLKRAHDSAPHTQQAVGKEGKQPRCEVELMQGDDHSLTKTYAVAEERVFRFLVDALGVNVEEQAQGKGSLVPSEEVGVEWMRKGHDLDVLQTGEHESIN